MNTKSKIMRDFPSQKDPSEETLEKPKKPLQKLLERGRVTKKVKPESKSGDEQIFWKIVHHWNAQPNLRKHKISGNLSKTLRTAKKLVFDALKGKLNIDHEMCIHGKKYNLRQFKDGITKLNIAASNPAVGMKTNRWAGQQSLSSFILNPAPIECSDPDGEFAFRNMSPFMFFIDNDVMEQERKKISKLKDADKTVVDDVYEQMLFSYGVYCNKELPDTEKNWKLAERMTEYFIKFIKENDYGLDKDMKKPHKLAAEYFGWYFDKPNSPSPVWMDSSKTKERFFEFMLESNFLTDERNGEIFDDGKFWFQLEQWQRDGILKQEAAERKKLEEVNNAIRERLRKEAEERKSKEVIVQSHNRFSSHHKNEISVWKKNAQKRALAMGRSKEFHTIWMEFAKKDKSDELKFEAYKQRIEKLLEEI